MAVEVKQENLEDKQTNELKENEVIKRRMNFCKKIKIFIQLTLNLFIRNEWMNI